MERIVDFNDYQEFTKSLAGYNVDVFLDAKDLDQGGEALVGIELPYMYPVVALAEEAGEVAGKVSKFIRKSNGGVTVEMIHLLRMDVLKELGDVLFQVSETARQFGWTLQDVVDTNQAKLLDRAERGVLVGEGDNR